MKQLSCLAFCLFLFSQNLLAKNYSENYFQFETNGEQKVELITSGIVSLDQRLKLIQKAKEFIHLEYYEFNTDTAGTLILQELIKKADEGIKVKLIVDAFLSKMQLTPELAYLLKRHNVEVKYYNDTFIINPYYNDRDHRKIFVVDGEKVILGGRNIGDAYFEIDSEYNFYDRDLLIEGNFAQKVDQSFLAMWNSPVVTTALKSTALLRNKEMNKAANTITPNNELVDFKRKLSERAYDITTTHPQRYTCNQMSFYSEYPLDVKNKKERVIKKMLAQKIENAEREIFIESPYFIIDKEIKKMFKRVENKNIDINVVTNSLRSNNQIVSHDAFVETIKYWINHGMNVYTLTGNAFLDYPVFDDQITAKAVFGTHAKTYLFDEKETFIGSYNFDPRSENINVELLVGCGDSQELATAVRDDLVYRAENSILLDDPRKLDKIMNDGVSKKRKLFAKLLRFPSLLILPYL